MHDIIIEDGTNNCFFDVFKGKRFGFYFSTVNYKHMLINMPSQRNINLLLGFLIILDLFLSAVCLFAPEFWTTLIHGTHYDDPAGFIRRMGAVWLAFLLFQTIALLKWKEYPALLVLIAGVRFTEVFSDWVYWIFTEQLTWFGHMGLLIAPPANLFFGIYFLKAFYQYKHIMEENATDEKRN